MNILVAVKRVVDYNVKVRVKSDNTGEHSAAATFTALCRKSPKEINVLKALLSL